MKPSATFLIVFFFIFSSITLKAQLPNGSIAPNWTLTDLNGNSHTLYSYLDSGYTVVIDFDVAWCPPSWAYHNTGYLQNLYINHGPAGLPNVSASTTNDVMVFFIECESSNSNAQLYGTGPTSPLTSTSQGNFVAGTPFPIIDLNGSAVWPITSAYMINYYPTIMMICPSHRMTVPGQLSDSLLYNEKLRNCFFAVTPDDASLTVQAPQYLIACDSVNPAFKLCNYGTSPLTSATLVYSVDGVQQATYNWTGSLSTYAQASISGIKLGASPGGHYVTATVLNPNGISDPSPSNNFDSTFFNLVSPAISSPIVEGFESSFLPPDWFIQNYGDTLTWKQDTVGAFNLSTKSALLRFYSMSRKSVHRLVMPAQSFAGQTYSSLRFDIAKAKYNSQYNDSLRVKLSTDCGLTWTSVYSKTDATGLCTVIQTQEFLSPSANQWRTEIVNLNAYSGMSDVLIMFEGICDFGNNLFLDNINLTGPTSIEEKELMQTAMIYPDPFISNATLEIGTEPVNCMLFVYDARGNEVRETRITSLKTQLSSEGLSPGMYFYRIVNGNTLLNKGNFVIEN